MNRRGPPVFLTLLVALSGCALFRGTPHQTSAQDPSPPPSSESEAPAAEQPEAPQPSTNNETPPPQQASSTAQIPPCVPPETKAKPKYKPKPKVVRNAAPPQIPTGSAVAETPPGGVVLAQVRPMPVSVMSILGKRVVGPTGEDFGRVVDVLADASGRVRTAIIDFGGFLGVGDRRIAVEWPLLRFNPDGGDPSLLLSLSRDQLKSAPEYRDNPRPQTLMEMPATGAPAPAAATPAAAPVGAPAAPPATAPSASTKK